MAEFRRFRILAWVNKYVFVCLSRFMCAHTPFHKPSHKKVSEVFFGRPLSTFYGVVCMRRRGALHRSAVMCFSLETVWEILGSKACASQGALTAIIFSQKKEHSPCLPDRSVLWKDMEASAMLNKDEGRKVDYAVCISQSAGHHTEPGFRVLATSASLASYYLFFHVYGLMNIVKASLTCHPTYSLGGKGSLGIPFLNAEYRWCLHGASNMTWSFHL